MRHRAVLVLLACLPALARGADLHGTVRFRGAAPAGASVETTKDRGVCGEAVPDETLLVQDGGLANAVVRVVAPGPRPEPGRATLDQQRCRFVPHVLALPAGSTLEIANGDPLLHNVHGYAGVATAFNLPMPVQGQKVSRTLTRTGPVKVGCDVHGWMGAWVFVVDGPFHAVSDARGRFVVPGLPAGTWPVVAWHERLGERTGSVTVPAAGPVELELVYP
jgi:plastocyanin